jgi:methionyl-tRNA synthetase
MLPETKDSEFTWKDFQARNNNELVAILGNFVNRTLVLTHKYFKGIVPQKGKLQPIDEELLQLMQDFPAKVGEAIEQFRFREAVALMIDMARAGNKYLAETEPWKAIKADEERVKTIMYVALQLTGSLAAVINPFLPFTSGKLSQMLNISVSSWEQATKREQIAEGHTIGQASLLFEKIEDKVVDAQIEKLYQTRKAGEEATPDSTPAKPEIQFDDFSKVDMRIGTILAAEKMEKSDKLLKLKVDTGIDQRTVLSGIAKHYTPEEIVGKQICILVNLAPRKMMGIPSEGMILMAEDRTGKLVFLQPSTTIDNGSEIS